MLWLPILCINFVVSAICFNLDVDHPIIIKNPDDSQNKSYFGYSVLLYSDGEHGKKWIKVGAPKATYHGHKERIQHSGIVYHCPFMERCRTQENLNYDATNNFDTKANLTNAWTGGSMDISYKYKTLAVSASSWQYFTYFKGKYSPSSRGGIFLENFEKNTLERNASLQYPVAYPRSVSYYSRAQTGFSLHFLQDENELLVGAPGVSNYLGTVFKIKNIEMNKTEWDLEIMIPRGNYYEYSGYALTSGCFYQQKELYYVTGLPRGHLKYEKNVLYGSVSIFQFTKKTFRFDFEYDIKLKAEFYGTQFGEYFGASLTAGDLNGDKLDDLIVGAPFRTNDKNGFNHGSVYVIYGHKTKLKQETKNRIDGTVTNGQFGLAVMFLGSLDQDGYGEFAVSAPQEETSGVVYIYSYDRLTKRLVVSQKILGKEISPSLRGFGMSFSRPYDIDDNHFSDILIGSPISGHVILLRSKPIVSVYKNIKAPLTISKITSTFSVKCCYSYSDYAESHLTIIRNLTVDGDQHPNRFSFDNKQLDKNSIEKEIQLERRKEFCESINVYKVLRFNDYNDSISITLTYRIPENQTANTKNHIFISETEPIKKDTFCKNCPILSHRILKSETKHIMWDHSCGGRVCESKLVTMAWFHNSMKNTFVLGSTDPLILLVNVFNNGDPALTPLLEIYLPNGVNLRRGPVNCENIEIDKVTCDLGEELRDKVSYYIEFNIDEGIAETEIKFQLNSSTSTKNIGNLNTLSMILKLVKVASFNITGESQESSYIYSKGETTNIKNIFKIEKMGPSPIPEIATNIIVPYEIMDSKGVYHKFADIEAYHGLQVIKCQNITDYKTTFPTKKLRPGFNITHSDRNFLKNTTSPMFDAISIFYINCTMGNVKCILLKCQVGPFDNTQKYTEVTIKMKTQFKDLEDMLKLHDSIIITTWANISSENFTQSDNRSDFTEVSNFLMIEKEYKVQTWVLIVSIIVGLVILIFLTLCLAKAGFFERKDQTKLRQLKEEALEEEKLLEELIEQELAKGNQGWNEENTLYGFIRHKETIKEVEEENPLYGSIRYKETVRGDCEENTL